MNGLENDLISIVMPAFNCEQFIRDSVESVLKQSYKNWELIIYDDCSTDRTREVISEFEADKKISLIEGEVNKGVAHARNKCMEEAQGRYVAFLDADDVWKPDKLKKQLDLMKETGCGVCYTSYEYIDSKGNPLNKKPTPIKIGTDYKSLLKNNYIGLLTVIIDLQITGRIIFSKEHHEDFFLWLELAKKNISMIGMEISTAFYRIRKTSLSGNKIKAAKWRWGIYYKKENLGLLKSLWYFTIYTTNALRKRPWI